MNVFYFVKRFPRRFKTAIQQKIFSMAQSIMNQGHRVHFVSADYSHPDEYKELESYPSKLIHVSTKRINASLSAAQIKPDIAIFNNFQMEQMYSAYLYNKWNKCPRILEVNSACSLQKWRHSKYSTITTSDNFIIPNQQNLYEPKCIFNSFELKSLLRSDYYITPNDFLYYLVKQQTESPQRISILSHGYPTNQFSNQVRQQEYRPFQSRKNFVFLSDLNKSHSCRMLYFLVKKIWPLIKKQLPEAQLHIYSSGNLKVNNQFSKKQMDDNGIIMKGYADDLGFLQKYKLLLYPARFSVGLKSKVIESWLHHTPVITTPIGAEGAFFQTLEAKYSVSQSESVSGFVNQRQFTNQQKQDEMKVKKYYSSNSLSCPTLKKLNFGGSFLNYSYLQFAKSAVQLYSDEKKWKQALKTGQKTIMKNQNQNQLQINIRQTLIRLQMASYTNRGSKQYEQEWKRIMKSKEYEKKIYQYR